MVRGLVGLKDGEDEGRFPDAGEVSVGKGKIEEGCKKGDAVATEMFQMRVGHVVGTQRRRIFNQPNSITGVVDCEWRI